MGNESENNENKIMLQILRYIGKENDSTMYFYDVEKHFAFFSEYTAKLFDIPEIVEGMPESVTKRSFLLPESQDEFIRIHRLIEETALEAEGTLKLRTAKGIDIIYALKLVRILNEDGSKTNGVIGSFKDVTERYIKDLSHENYQKILDGSKRMQFIYDKKKDSFKISFREDNNNKSKDRTFFFYSRMIKEEQICKKADVGILLDFLNNGSEKPIQIEMFDQYLEEYRWFALTGAIKEDNPNLLEGVAEDITDLKTRSNNKEKLYKVLNILSEDYLFIYEVDLINDSYEALLGDFNRLGFVFPEKGVYSEENKKIAEKVCDSHREMRLNFGLIENIRNELKDKRKLVCEFKTTNEDYPWRKALIQKQEEDEDGYPTKVLISHIYMDESELESQTVVAKYEDDLDEKRILVVEDYELNAKLAMDNARIAGLKADWAASKEEALEKINRKSYTMILMDDKLKGATGFEVSKEIRNQNNTTPIVLCSLKDSKELDIKCEEAGINTHVAKPLAARQLKYLEEKLVKSS